MLNFDLCTPTRVCFGRGRENEAGALIAAQGARELRGGFIGASPYKECPSWCKFKGICGTEGDRVRRECSATCADIANAAHAAKEKV